MTKVETGFTKAERLVDQLISKDNWGMIDEMDNFIYVFDRLPDRMRLCVDLRMTGMSVKEIAKAMKTTERQVQDQLLNAKKRFLRGENVL